MNRAIRQYGIAVGLAIWAAGCVSTPPPSPQPAKPAPNAGVYRIGKPYQIGGIWYYPREQPDYDETGIASWYGPGFYGRLTSDGEIYSGQDLTAAHKTLPLPVNVRVTNLENGHSMILRVNDRGPFARGRVIDVSEQAAKALGFYQQGTAKVRVQYLGRADLPDGEPQPFGANTPADIASAATAAPKPKVASEALTPLPNVKTEAGQKIAPMPRPAQDAAPSITPNGQVSVVPVPAQTRIYVQLGAFGNYQNARKAVFDVNGDAHIYPFVRDGKTLYRVRMGPYDTVDTADDALSKAISAGKPDAQIIVDQ